MRSIFLLSALLCTVISYGQLHVDPAAIVFLQQGATITVEHDVDIASDILGEGLLRVTGSAARIDMHGHALPALAVQVDQALTLTGDAVINNNLLFERGRIDCGGQQLTLNDHAIISGASSEHYIVTGTTGRIRQVLHHAVDHLLIPVANADVYAPVELTTGQVTGEGFVDVAARSGRNEHIPAEAKSYLPLYWTVGATNMSSSLTVKAHFAPTGVAQLMESMAWDGNKWEASGAHDDLSLSVLKGQKELTAFTKTAPRLFPNPCHTYTVLSIDATGPQKAVLEILDGAGQSISSRQYSLETGHNLLRLDVSALAGGQYLLRAATSRGTAIIGFSKR